MTLYAAGSGKKFLRFFFKHFQEAEVSEKVDKAKGIFCKTRAGTNQK